MSYPALSAEDALAKLTLIRAEAEALMSMYVFPGYYVPRLQIAAAQDRFKSLKQEIELEFEKTQGNVDQASDVERAFYAPTLQQIWTRLSPMDCNLRPSFSVFSALGEFSSTVSAAIASLQSAKAA